MKISDRCCDCPAFFIKCRAIYGGPECQNFHKLVEEKFTPTNSVRDAIALNTLRNKFEEIYRVHGQGGASYLYQEMMREFDEFIAAQQHP